MAVPAPLQTSANVGNLTGSFAGAVAGIAVGALSHFGYLAAAAAFVGFPEATVAAVAAAVIGAGVNYAATRVAQVKSLNDLYNALPSTYPEYPKNPNVPSA